MDFQTVLFEKGKSKLSDDGKNAINKISKVLSLTICVALITITPGLAEDDTVNLPVEEFIETKEQLDAT